MELCEPTSLLLSKIKSFDPENASKILGFLLLNGLPEEDLMRLVLGPDTVLQNLIFKAKSQLGLLPNTSCAPISRPNLSIPSPTANNGGHPFSHSPRIAPSGDGRFHFTRSLSSVPPWSGSVFPSSNPFGLKDTPLLSYDNIRAGAVSVPPLSHQSNGNGADAVSRSDSDDLIDESQLSDYFSFLNESSKHDDLVDPRDELGYVAGTHLHRRSYSASDACFGSEDGGFVAGGFKPCLYFARGFCKNGSSCKFVHGGFPEKFDGSVEVMRLKAAEQHRLAALSQCGPRPMPPRAKYMNLLLQQQNDPQRSAAAAALMMHGEYHRFDPFGPERNDFAKTGLADKLNSVSRQIYLTFPADSNFKDEDVAEYFGNYGPVQDVRIPYQQKRMFGFVTFVFPETVKLILARGNPHFICDSRVLVKPYKEKGKVLDRRQHQIERADFSGCLSPSENDDLHLGARSFYSEQEMMFRRKVEDADLQQAIELQGRRLINLHLLDDQFHHHQRSISVGALGSLPEKPHTDACHDVAEGYKDSPAVHNHGSDNNSKENCSPFENDDSQSIEQFLSDGVFGSPTALSDCEEHNAISSTTSENNVTLLNSWPPVDYIQSKNPDAINKDKMASRALILLE